MSLVNSDTGDDSKVPDIYYCIIEYLNLNQIINKNLNYNGDRPNIMVPDKFN